MENLRTLTFRAFNFNERKYVITARYKVGYSLPEVNLIFKSNGKMVFLNFSHNSVAEVCDVSVILANTHVTLDSLKEAMLVLQGMFMVETSVDNNELTELWKIPREHINSMEKHDAEYGHAFYIEASNDFRSALKLYFTFRLTKTVVVTIDNYNKPDFDVSNVEVLDRNLYRILEDKCMRNPSHAFYRATSMYVASRMIYNTIKL